MLSKFNCNTLGWNTVPFVFINIFSRPLYRAIDPQCVCMFLYRMHGPINYLIVCLCWDMVKHH